ncbi:hypothetical protein MBLNU459_g1603t3 [Dothideomycetes sp. NU459]
MTDAKEIKHPRRLLVVGSPDSGFARPLKEQTELTGSAPAPDASGSFAGATHEWRITTPYYAATVPVWIDELTDTPSWKAEFLRPEAAEVIQAVGAWIYCFKRGPGRVVSTAAPDDDDSGGGGAGGLGADVEAVMAAIEEVVETACPGWDGARVALDMSGAPPAGGPSMEVVEEQCMDRGFEYVHVDAAGKNEFGEAVGLARVREALEANDWSAQGLGVDGDQEDLLGGFDAEEAQMNAELWGLKASLLAPDADEGQDGDGALQVEGLDQMMGQLLAIRETGAGMPEDERKRFAARAVSDLMKNL